MNKVFFYWQGVGGNLICCTGESEKKNHKCINFQGGVRQDFQAANHTTADARQSIAENCRGALAQLWPFIGVEALPRSLLKNMIQQLLGLISN